MTQSENDIAVQVGQIAVWIESHGNKGQQIEDLQKAGLPIDVLSNDSACDGIVFYADGSKSTKWGTYHGWYVRKDPHWSKVWGDRYGWETQNGQVLQALRDETKRRAEVRKLTKKPPKLSSWDKYLLQRFNDRVSAAADAYHTLQHRNFVILDTETVDLNPAYLVSLTVIDPDGWPLIDTLLNPQYPSSEVAVDIHGIEDWQVVGAPYFPDIWPRLCEVVEGKEVFIYNADFDIGAIQHEAWRWGLIKKERNYSALKGFDAQCAMHLYAQFYGEWNDYHEDYAWQSLGAAAEHFGLEVQEPAHSALGDCLRTLGVLQGMSDFYVHYKEMQSWLKSS